MCCFFVIWWRFEVSISFLHLDSVMILMFCYDAHTSRSPRKRVFFYDYIEGFLLGSVLDSAFDSAYCICLVLREDIQIVFTSCHLRTSVMTKDSVSAWVMRNLVGRLRRVWISLGISRGVLAKLRGCGHVSFERSPHWKSDWSEHWLRGLPRSCSGRNQCTLTAS